MSEETEYGESPWRDEDLLRELYHEQGMTQREIGNELGCAPNTVSRWVREFDIETGYSKLDKLRDSQWLHEQYITRDKSGIEIADELDCSKRTVYLWLREHGIPVEKPTWKRPAYLRTDHHGYERWEVTIDGKAESFPVHRLLAIAKYGIDAVKGLDVHHKNHIKWDNRPENIELKNRSDHRTHDMDQRERDTAGRVV